MARYAAVDIGSNSVRMMAADVGSDGHTQILAEDRHVTRLGAGVFADGHISSAALQFVCGELVRMGRDFRRLEISSLRAVATSAVRDAANQAEFLERTQAALGAPVEIISGQEEARLIHLGVQARWPHPKGRILIIDVGGGSTELIIGDHGQFLQAYSKPLGAVRLTGAFLSNDPPAGRELHRMMEYIDEKLADPAANLHGPFDRVIATSATAAALVCAANQVPRPRRHHADRLSATTGQVRDLYRKFSHADLAARRGMTGVGPQRAELIVAGSAVFLRTLEAFGEGALHYSMGGVRDGIIADLAERGASRERAQLGAAQRTVVEDMARHYGVQLPHVRQVAWLAGELFKSLHGLHGLPPHYGKLLEAAAYLHDIGHFVSNTGHHKHSYYLVASSDLPGFTGAERNFIAWLCRYHRRARPDPSHAFFQTVKPTERDAVILLTPLLRLADSLDRSHEQRVHEIDVQSRGRQVAIRLRANGAPPQDIDLEVWAAQRNSDLFRETFQASLALEAKV